MTLLTVRDLNVDLGARPVLRDLAFEARAGQIVGLIGPNGAGKTTLLRAVCQLVPARTGEVVWDGQAVNHMSARRRATSLAYLPQGQTLHWPLSVRRLVELGRLPRLGALSHLAPSDAAAVGAAMAAADVADLAERDTLTLSGGERARVLLARALAVDAPVLLADEPTASLDPYHVLEIMGLLRRFADQGRLVIAVIHELNLVARFCDKVVLLNDGRVAAEGPPRQVLSPDRLREVYRVDPAALVGPDLFKAAPNPASAEASSAVEPLSL
jgi:iron complex transport system ATP-binding protein